MQPEISTLLIDAGSLLVVGMVAVFIFLTLLIFAVHLIAKLHTILPQTAPEHTSPAASPVTTHDDEQPSQATIAAISAAVHAYRRKHR